MTTIQTGIVYSPTISVTPSTLVLVEGAHIKVVGNYFPKNINGNIVDEYGNQVGTFTTDSNGNFKHTLKYSVTNNTGLVQVIQLFQNRNFINIKAIWSSGQGQGSSNTVTIFF
jgi:hypothetical protein